MTLSGVVAVAYTPCDARVLSIGDIDLPPITPSVVLLFRNTFCDLITLAVPGSGGQLLPLTTGTTGAVAPPITLNGVVSDAYTSFDLITSDVAGRPGHNEPHDDILYTI
jgi:hypothetical protein